jgi:hypothetical protein
MGLMPSTLLLLVTGEQLDVDGPMSDVDKTLENAARSGAGTLALLTETASQKPVAVNPAHVVTVRPGDE